MIKFDGLPGKPVAIGIPQPEIHAALRLLAIWNARAAPTLDVRITSMRDGTHAPNSLHYRDLAVDLQVVDKRGRLQAKRMDALAVFLRRHLPRDLGWDLVWRQPRHHRHLHLEFDVKIPNQKK
jgi:hypothetical protein